ncbi:MerR family DNA-binding transcriptional regulator [Pseudomonas sp. CBSPBW29]|jgi:DNA-binding transcriptional MerR regulator|uniref:MerR family transcriptional regulator n=1 Tax=Pseudomonas TaxID=286 RepID=UPI0021AD1480|nr:MULTISPECIES: MerR family transcriptional regulator [unclassified Pseudomonas]WEL40010.1 MerR family DNA-binding transcriptional regulator [Pseudomonas sp. CBSPBW29]WEL66761.1 MerR family DNA-binding transcriptional regulator [Pseudomonas sp. CBSPGW29]WEL70251.1 MerR family DNA-binding transcriptional regulator [Pseudomonas sp. CBSPCGW29]WEL77202.1 MerR family DNA-binding transcriptional regulator [Pseudomonas sp. CBSPAW29]WEL84190.1 MerR family DNA-binding transcriptional regulator [Pseudo
MRIGELAQASQVSRDTLRFYEQRGLIAAQRSANGYRDYPADMVQLVLYIKTAQRLGFSLGEIGNSVGALWQAPDPDSAVTQLLQDKLSLIETRIAELDQLRQELQQRLGQRCPLNP